MNFSGGERWPKAAPASLTASLLHLLVEIIVAPCLMGKFGARVGERFLCAVIMGGGEITVAATENTPSWKSGAMSCSLPGADLRALSHLLLCCSAG